MQTKKMLIIITALFLFCSCAATVQQTESQPIATNNEDSTNAYHWTGQPFYMISSADYTNYGNGNTKGFYSVFQNKDQSRNLLYIDYSTQKQVYLCSRPNCEHNSEICTSWIAPFDGTVIPAVTENTLFLIYSSRNTNPRIDQLELNGTKVKTVFSLPSGAMLENAIAANDTTLVVSIQEIDTSKNLAFNSSLQAIDLANGTTQVLFSLQKQIGSQTVQNASLTFKGVTATGFVVESSIQYPYVLDEKDVDKSFANMEAAMQQTTYEIPFDSSAPKQLLSFSANQCNTMPFDSYLFYLQKNEVNGIALKKLHTQTGETTTLIEDFTNTFLGETAKNLTPNGAVFRAFFDGNLLLNVVEKDYVADNGNMELVFAGLCIDIASGETRRINLTNSYHATTVPVDILSQYEKNLLVFAQIQPSNSNNLNVGEIERKVGLISMENYVNSIGEYHMIDTLRSFS